MAKNGNRPLPSKSNPAEWTVMIYMIADDPAGGELLDQQANRELDEIIFATLGANRDGRLKVAVQVDFRNQPDVWRRVIGEGAWLQPESEAADPATLYGFFDWVDKTCPADRYLLILWGHSRGPFGLFTDRPFSSMMAGPFAPEDPRSYIAQTLTLKELRGALDKAQACLRHKIDVIAFKDCFMSTLETAYELEALVDYIVASPDIVPIEGWPYSAMFKGLVGQTDTGVAARMIVDALHAHYDDPKQRHGRKEVPYTLMDTSKLTAVSKSLRSMVATLEGDGAGRDEARSALSEASDESTDSALLDLGKLSLALIRCGLEKEGVELRSALKALLGRASGAPAAENVYVSTAGAPVGGAAISTQAVIDRPAGVGVFYYPPTETARKKSFVAPHATRSVYRALAIAQETGWDRVSTDKMPEGFPATETAQAAYGNGNVDTLLPMILERLQRGLLEEIARKSSGFGKYPGFYYDKYPGFAKSAGFVTEFALAKELDEKIP